MAGEMKTVRGQCLPFDNAAFLSTELARQMSLRVKPRINLNIVQAKPEDESRILRFLQKYFYPDEPISAAKNRIPGTANEVFPLSCLPDGYSYLATNTLDNSEDNLVGVILNGAMTSSEVAVFDQLLEKHKGTSYEEVIWFLRRVEYEADVWDRFQIQRMFKTFIIAVSSAYRGLNIGQKLMAASKQRAESGDFSHMAVDCTSFYSSRLVEKMDFRCVYELPYDSHRDQKGEVIFKTKEPHKSVKLFLQEL